MFKNKYKYLADCEWRFSYSPEAIPQDFAFRTDNVFQSFKSYKELEQLCDYNESKTTETLSQCLPNLLNLRKVTIVTNIDKPGLNIDNCTWANFDKQTASAGEVVEHLEEPRRILKQAIANGLRPLPLHQEPLLASCESRQAHGDPFDRLLYAQAKHGGFRLLTIDRKLAALGAVAITPR